MRVFQFIRGGPGQGVSVLARTGYAVATRAERDSRGMALITTAFVVFAVGMMLFGFIFLNQSEVSFAAFNRNGTQALGLAEAGIQEAINRLNTFGTTLGSTPSGSPCPGTAFNAFTNSLASSTSGGAGTVTYQLALQSNSAVFPIMSCATFAGVQRVVRIFERATYTAGFGNVIFGPQVAFSGDASPSTGDAYAQQNVSFAQYQKSPLCASGATAANLVSPQVMAGTTVAAGSGPNQTPPCGSPTNAGSYNTECASGSTTEVAPTPCPGGGRAVNGGNTIPVNWHPMTPIGMSSTDFNTVVSQCYAGGCAVTGGTVTIQQATQNAVGVPYSLYAPASYTPAYWSAPATSPTNGKVELAVATAPFCLLASPASIQSPSGGTCSSGYTYYGVSGATTRYLDWGLVSDDLSRSIAQTFFQAPTCSTCNGGLANGLQNGIRYIALLPTINVVGPPGSGQACAQNVSPGTNVFDKVNSGDGITCTSPPTTTISSTNVTFSGTKSSQEALVIDNKNFGTVSLNGSIAGNSTLTCGNTNFDNYNWGLILATGDIDLQANFVFTGLIYTPGNITSHGNVLIRGGVFSPGVQGSSSSVNLVDSLGTANFCSSSQDTLTLSKLFFSFSFVSWQDRPLSQR